MSLHISSEVSSEVSSFMGHSGHLDTSQFCAPSMAQFKYSSLLLSNTWTLGGIFSTKCPSVQTYSQGWTLRKHYGHGK
jgi:hypothetical protein